MKLRAISNLLSFLYTYIAQPLNLHNSELMILTNVSEDMVAHIITITSRGGIESVFYPFSGPTIGQKKKKTIENPKPCH